MWYITRPNLIGILFTSMKATHVCLLHIYINPSRQQINKMWTLIKLAHHYVAVFASHIIVSSCLDFLFFTNFTSCQFDSKQHRQTCILLCRNVLKSQSGRGLVAISSEKYLVGVLQPFFCSDSSATKYTQPL